MITAKKFKEMVIFVRPFTKKGDRSYCCSHLLIKQKDNRLEVVATNKLVDDLKPILSKIPDNDYIQFEDFPDYLLINKNMIEKGNLSGFDNYEPLLRDESCKPITEIFLDQSEIKQALKRLKVIAEKEITNVLEFHLDSGKLVLKCDNVDAMGEEVITSSSVYGKTDEKFLFNLNNIKRAVNKLKKGRLRIRYYDDVILKSVYLINEKRPSYEIVIAQLERIHKKSEAIEKKYDFRVLYPAKVN